MSEWNQGDPEPKLIIPISRVVVQITHRRFWEDVIAVNVWVSSQSRESDLKNLCGVITAEMQHGSLCYFLMILSPFLSFFLS